MVQLNGVLSESSLSVLVVSLIYVGKAKGERRFNKWTDIIDT